MPPPIVATIAEVRAAVAEARRAGKKVGLVPTMGALHAGHASLVRTARMKTDFAIVTIFVNPTQFGPNEDYNRYPRTLEADRDLVGAVGADLIFAPLPAEIYPDGHRTFVEVTELGDHLCGASRPGHFRGVATVVLKLFNIVQPDVAFFGQKDAQQAAIIQQMTRDLDVPIRVEIVPTVREPDGLAMSSRNRYLDPTQRRHATVLFRALEKVKSQVAAGERDVAKLEAIISQEVASTPGARLDYARIVDGVTLQPINTLQRPALAALAVFFGTTRLIDNVTLSP
ncbi:MAG: pantoate--beta-alanine ligase [Planctomycetes bacterium]|nr:pantoate--beta-alanine ligase [Planctomycetota bacterium]